MVVVKLIGRLKTLKLKLESVAVFLDGLDVFSYSADNALIWAE